MTAVKVLSHLFPGYFAHKIYDKFLHPQIQKLRDHEVKVLETANQETLKINNNRIQVYRWGKGSKKVLFVHGWEGHAGNYADLVKYFSDYDYTIYAFDGPGHGKSSGGKNIMFEYTETVHKVISHYNIDKLVSHSFGSVATTYSLTQIPNHKIKRFVMLTTPRKFSGYVNNMTTKMGISPKAIRLFFNKIENESNYKIDDLDVSKYVQSTNVEKALILHDKADKVIPISEARAVALAWPLAQIKEIENTGHFRILRTPAVAEQVFNFIDS